MDSAQLLLLLLYLLTIGNLVAFKLCASRLDHRAVPLFVGFWTLLGVAAAAPFYGDLWAAGWQKFMASPAVLVAALLRGGLLYLLFVMSQKLMKASLSSRHYVTPLAVGVLTILNSFFGERLTPLEWASSLGLCALAAGFFFKGHLATLDRSDRLAYGQIVLLTAVISTLDQIATKGSNWFSALLASTAVLFVLSLALNWKDKAILKSAFLQKTAALAGVLYAAAELVKFYQQVTINPVSVVVTAQAATKPVILILSAVVWKERTVKEQAAWGLGAFLVTLPLFLPKAAIDAVLHFLGLGH